MLFRSRIGHLNESLLLEPDDFNLTPYALKNTLFAALLPFKFSTFIITQTDSSGQPTLTTTDSYATGVNGNPPIEGFTAGYTFPSNSTGLFKLAYASPSSPPTPVACPGNGRLSCFDAILVYQLNN